MDALHRRYLGWILTALAIVAVVFMAGCCGLMALWENSRVAKGVPPDLIASFREAKSSCEGEAQRAKDAGQARRASAKQLDEGRRIYIGAKSEIDGCIDYLRASLAERFANHDPDAFDRRLSRARAQVRAFLAWADQIDARPGAGAVDPLTGALDLIRDWVNYVRKATDETIRQLSIQLDECRLRDWGDLH